MPVPLAIPVVVPLLAGGGGFLFGLTTSNKFGSALKILAFALAVFLMLILLPRLGL